VTPAIFGTRSNISSKLFKLVTSYLVSGFDLPLLFDCWVLHIIVYREAVRSAILAKAWLLVTVKGTKNPTTLNRLGDRQADRQTALNTQCSLLGRAATLSCGLHLTWTNSKAAALMTPWSQRSSSMGCCSAVLVARTTISPFWRGFINTEEPKKLSSILTKFNLQLLP